MSEEYNLRELPDDFLYIWSFKYTDFRPNSQVRITRGGTATRLMSKEAFVVARNDATEVERRIRAALIHKGLAEDNYDANKVKRIAVATVGTMIRYGFWPHDGKSFHFGQTPPETIIEIMSQEQQLQSQTVQRLQAQMKRELAQKRAEIPVCDDHIDAYSPPSQPAPMDSNAVFDSVFPREI